MKKQSNAGTTQPLYTVKCPHGHSVEITPSSKALSSKVYCPKCKKAFEPLMTDYAPKSIKEKALPGMKFFDRKDDRMELGKIRDMESVKSKDKKEK